MLPNAHKEIVNERRAQVAELLFRGLSYDEIARNVVVREKTFDRSTIKRDIKWIRRNQLSWWVKNGKIAQRFARYFKHELDSLKSGKKRAWEQYDKANVNEDGNVAVKALRVVLEFVSKEWELLGLLGGNLNEIEGREKLEQFEKELDRLLKKTNATDDKTKTGEVPEAH